MSRGVRPQSAGKSMVARLAKSPAAVEGVRHLPRKSRLLVHPTGRANFPVVRTAAAILIVRRFGWRIKIGGDSPDLHGQDIARAAPES